MCCLPCWVLNSFPVTISCLQPFKPAGIQGHAPSVILQNFLRFSVRHVLSLPPDVPSQPTSTISSLKSPVLPLKPPIALQVLHRVWITPQDGLGLTLLLSFHQPVCILGQGSSLSLPCVTDSAQHRSPSVLFSVHALQVSSRMCLFSLDPSLHCVVTPPPSL